MEPKSSEQIDDANLKLLTKPVQFVKGVGAKRAQLMAKLGIRTSADLLFYFPSRYEDFTGHFEIGDLIVGETANVVGLVEDIDQQIGMGRHILYVLIKQSSGCLRAIWFNQSYLMKKFKIGQKVQFRGKVGERGGRLQMTHPEITWIDEQDSLNDATWQPVYRLTDGINQKQMRQMVSGAVDRYANLVAEAIPEELQIAEELSDIANAIRKIHAPKNEAEFEYARKRLVFQELLVLQLALAMRRHSVVSRCIAPPIELTPKIRARILGRLPFELRDSQLKAFEEIGRDMGNSTPMNRLLHGEVGSGKTAVSACSMLLAVANGFQAALMAPTEILARQHYHTLSQWLKGSHVRFELCTGGMSQKKRSQIEQSLSKGEIDIVIGTTALISGSVSFSKLGLAVVDEQHKFGVRQRAQLKQSGFDPHFLVMTATPIPRTVTMTLFGDLDVSVLTRDFPANVKTYLGTERNRDQWWSFFVDKLRQGRQGYVVAPFVDSGGKQDIRSAEAMYESLSNGPLEAFRMTLLHGRQDSDEKQMAMQKFVSGEAQVLVATGVIEVGIDVPNATVMTIESAERFGLSQLHQLRGRVGRGIHTGFVTAFPTPGKSSEIERLQAFAESNDGFELAQTDLKLRGPGNLLSTKQTGFPPLKIADIVKDEEILIKAQLAARKIIDRDPDLARPEFYRLRKLVVSRYARVLDLSDVG